MPSIADGVGISSRPWTELEIHVTNLSESFYRKMRTKSCDVCVWKRKKRHVISAKHFVQRIFFCGWAFINFLWNALICEWCATRRVTVDAWQMEIWDPNEDYRPIQNLIALKFHWSCHMILVLTDKSDCFQNEYAIHAHVIYIVMNAIDFKVSFLFYSKLYKRLINNYEMSLKMTWTFVSISNARL